MLNEGIIISIRVNTSMIKIFIKSMSKMLMINIFIIK